MDQYSIPNAIANGLLVVGTIDLNSDTYTDNINSAVTVANSQPAGTIIAIACGNELSSYLNKDFSEAVQRIQACASALRQNLNDQSIRIGTHEITAPFVSNDTVNAPCNFVSSGYSSLDLDYYGVDIYSFYANFFDQTICPAGKNMDTWVSYLFGVYCNIQKCVAESSMAPVIITETGWPGSNASNAILPNVEPGCDEAPCLSLDCTICGNYYCTDNYKQQYISNVTAYARDNLIPLILFEGYDEPWKRTCNGQKYFWEADFGLCSSFSPYYCRFSVF